MIWTRLHNVNEIAPTCVRRVTPMSGRTLAFIDDRARRALYRRSSQAESRLACLGHLLVENRHGLIADAMATIAEGFGEPEAATLMMLKFCCMVDDWDMPHQGRPGRLDNACRLEDHFL